MGRRGGFKKRRSGSVSSLADEKRNGLVRAGILDGGQTGESPRCCSSANCVRRDKDNHLLEIVSEELTKLLEGGNGDLKRKVERLASVMREKTLMFVESAGAEIVNGVDGTGLGAERLTHAKESESVSDRVGQYRFLKDSASEQGSRCVVLYQTELGKTKTERYRVIHLETMVEAILNFSRLKKIPKARLVSKFSITRLSLFAPNIFWNVVRIFSGKVTSGTSRILNRAIIDGFSNKDVAEEANSHDFEAEECYFELDDQLRRSLYEKTPYYRRNRIPYISGTDFFGRTLTNKGDVSSDSDTSGLLEKDEFTQDADTAVGLRRSGRASFGVNSNQSIIEASIDTRYKLLKTSISTYPEKWKKTIYKYCILNGVASTVLIKSDPSKGRCVIAGSRIRKDDFVLEYKGYLITSLNEAELLNEIYEKTNKGCFMYYFRHNDRNYCIDATEESAYFGPGRLINHSKKNPNLTTKVISINDIPRLFFVSKRDLECGEELLFDYGDKDPVSVLHHPWLLD